MNDSAARHYRAGDPVEDHCRVCKMARRHTVIAADLEGQILRVSCDTCGSAHHFRGGAPPDRPAARASSLKVAGALVAARERRYPPVSVSTDNPAEGIDLELLLRRIIREEIGLTPAAMAEKWHGGELVLRPGKPQLQEKSWPIEAFFHKVVMLRNRLRVLEQQINGAELPQELKLKLQGYITGCYGTLTSFNVLFADEEDRFQGSSGD